MSHSNSTKAVVFALLGNMFISIIKYIAVFFYVKCFYVSRSYSLDSGLFKSSVLLIGTKRSKKENDELHPFGYGREEFFGVLWWRYYYFFGAIFQYMKVCIN
jgi:divalent metal cation (Fe/Co/Zn/Cd) transporter